MNRRDLLKMPAAMAAPAVAQQPETGPGLFDNHQSETLAALAECIVPGAKAAGVPRYLEAILAASSVQQRQHVTDGLSWLDGHAIGTQGKPFVRLAPADSVKLLEAIESSQNGDLEPGRAFLGRAKGFIARVFYSTREGFTELNRGGRVPATFACAHKDKEHA